MTKELSDAVFKAVRSVVDDAQASGHILDAYVAAEQIRQNFPEENLAVGELVALMLRSNLHAVEISPPALIIEIEFPVEEGSDAEMMAELTTPKLPSELVG